MATNFKIGDLVICINNKRFDEFSYDFSDTLVLNKVYKVTHVYIGYKLGLAGVSDLTPFSSRFIKIEDELGKILYG